MNGFLKQNEKNILYAMAAIGVAGIVGGFLLSPRFWQSFLHNSYFFMTIALGGAVFVAVNHVANAGWHTTFRRVPEAMTTYIWVGAITILAIYLGKETLYEWTYTSYSHHGHELTFKNTYLDSAFFLIRMLVILACWCGLTFLLRRESFKQDATGDIVHTSRSKTWSALFLVVFGITFTFASFDWIMSIEPMFFSTIYGFYHIAGVLLSGTAAITLLTILLKRRGYLEGVGDKQMHALGKLVLGFATFWAYIWVCQYLLIYYANIPEETIHYVKRTSPNGWWQVFILALFLNWIVPFLMLLRKKVKMYENWMLAACGIVLIGHWVDIYIQIFPTFYPTPMIGFVDIALLLGFSALFIFVFTKGLSADALVPRNDPYLSEAEWQGH
ncbi:MAG: hypothetical protein HKN33_10580 [Pyrinomonadaceae bacterium]|nr:hypothetical protein [Pyrinomonadaceae bacterium]